MSDPFNQTDGVPVSGTSNSGATVSSSSNIRSGPTESAISPIGGIGRLQFILGAIIVSIVLTMLGILLPAGMSAVIVGVGVAASLSLAYFRMKNIGVNPWFCLLWLIPLVGFGVTIFCVAFPEGWKYHRQLDLSGKVAIGVLGVIFIFGLVFGLLF